MTACNLTRARHAAPLRNFVWHRNCSTKKIMKPIRILFVEDDAEMTGIYQENFSGPEFESECAANGMEAMKLLHKAGKQFDVIVSDNYMPQMDGITLLRKIRQTLPTTNVIIVTGYGDWKQYIDAH